MAGEWSRITIRAVAANTPNALVGGPFGSNLVTDDYVSSGVPVIRGQNMGGRWISGDFAFVTDAKARALSANVAKPGDLIFTQRGTLGQVSIVPPARFERYIVSQSQMKLTANPDIADPLFLYYLFSTREQQEYIRQNAIQTGVPHTNLGILRDTPVFIPPIGQQRAIARILGALDDKIELNRRMNETLEAMARALFKSWFIDFDPVRAKAEGRNPHLPVHIADLFPARLVGSDFEHPVPEGWLLGALSDHVLNFDSQRVPLSGAERAKRQGRHPYHGAAGVLDHIDDYLFDGIYALVGEDGSVLRGNGLAVTQYVWGKFWVNNHAHVLRGKGQVSTEQLFLYFDFQPVAPYVTGAVQPKLSQGRMNLMPFVYAGEGICLAFAKLVQPWFARLRANADENISLNRIRDTLLPKLISGEIRVKDAERFVEATAA